MGEIRIPKKGSKYWLPKQQFLTAFHYCQQFPNWEKDYRQLTKEAGVSAAPSSRTPRGSDAGDPTGAAAVRLAEIERKMKIIGRSGTCMMSCTCRASGTCITTGAGSSTISWRRGFKRADLTGH